MANVPRLLAVPTAAVLLVGGLGGVAAATAAAAPTTSPAGSSASSAGSIRWISQGSARQFPAGTALGRPKGVESPEFPGGDVGPDAAQLARQRAVTNRSLSARPSSTSPTLRSLAPTATILRTGVTGKARSALSFTGLNLFDQRYANGGNQFSLEPPDQGLCASGRYVLETVNTVLRVYSPTGRALSAPTDLNTFYGYPDAVDRTTGRIGPVITDPSCYFDPEHQRFIHVVLTLDVVPTTGAYTGTNHLDIAVSRTANPLGRWNFYSIPVTNDGSSGTARHANCPCIGDYPHIGADANGIYLTTNEYPFFSSGFNGAQLYALPKAALASGAARVPVVEFQNLTLTRGHPGFTVWPANSPAGQYDNRRGGTEYFLSSTAADEANGTGFSKTIGVWSLTNTVSLNSGKPAPVLARSTLSVPQYAVPPKAQQKAGPTPLATCLRTGCLAGIGPAPAQEGLLDANDSRMQQVWYTNGQLYGALDTAVYIRTVSQLRAGIATYRILAAPNPANARLVGSLTGGLENNDVTYPAIAAKPDGTAIVAFTLTGANFYPSAAYVVDQGGSIGSVQIPGLGVGPQDGFSEYDFFSDSGVARPRWGDYGAALVQGNAFWIASEFIAQRCTIQEYRVDPTCGNTRAPLGNWATRITKVTP